MILFPPSVVQHLANLFFFRMLPCGVNAAKRCFRLLTARKRRSVSTARFEPAPSRMPKLTNTMYCTATLVYGSTCVSRVAQRLTFLDRFELNSKAFKLKDVSLGTAICYIKNTQGQ